MTINIEKLIVYFSKLWLLAMKFISWRVWMLTDQVFLGLLLNDLFGKNEDDKLYLRDSLLLEEYRALH
jgi:hypothetical protein